MLRERKSGIYRILNTITGKYYIGSAIYLNQRRTNHFRDLSKNKHCNTHLQRAYNKYSKDNFIFEILEYCNKEELIMKEQEYFDNMKPHYNMQKIAGGSALGLKRTKETCEKISKALTGRALSEEHKNKCRIAAIGKNVGKNNVCSRPISQYTKEGTLIASFDCITEASKKTGIIRTGINNCLHNRSKQSGGFIWKFRKEVSIAD